MNKKELAAAVAGDTGMSQSDAAAAVDAVFDAITKAMKGGDEVRVSGFGTFKPQYRPARTARNPQTGKDIKVKETAVAKFQPAKSLKEAVAKAKNKVKPKK